MVPEKTGFKINSDIFPENQASGYYR